MLRTRRNLKYSTNDQETAMARKTRNAARTKQEFKNDFPSYLDFCTIKQGPMLAGRLL